MTELVDLYADPSGGDITSAEIGDYVERALRGNAELSVTHQREHKLLRRSVGALFHIIGTLMPDGHPQKEALLGMGRMPTTDQWVSLMDAAAKLEQAEVLVDTLNARADLRRAAWAVEEAQRELAALPVVDPVTDFDTGTITNQDELAAYMTQRDELRSVIDFAPAEVAALVAQRATARGGDA